MDINKEINLDDIEEVEKYCKENFCKYCKEELHWEEKRKNDPFYRDYGCFLTYYQFNPSFVLGCCGECVTFLEKHDYSSSAIERVNYDCSVCEPKIFLDWCRKNINFLGGSKKT